VEKNKREVIDVKDLPKLVPSEYLPKINLLFNKDVPKEPKTADELLIYRLAQLKESDMQQYFNKQVIALDYEVKQLNKLNQIHFVQIDNGDGAAGNLTNNQRLALLSRKKAEGSKKGFSDLMILFEACNIRYRDIVFCEAKKIAAPSGIHITEEQLKWFIILNDMGFDAYITNNPIFFRDVVLKKIKNYFI
jgi:hypothetical protein